MRQIATRPRNVVALSIIAVILIVGAIAASIYNFGGGGGRSSTAANSTVTVQTLAPSSGSIAFTIDDSSSKATFTIDEVLFGSPNTVVGQTNQVAGQILVNQQDPSQSKLGEIKVDLSTLVTITTCAIIRCRGVSWRLASLATSTPRSSPNRSRVCPRALQWASRCRSKSLALSRCTA
jgi:YceI-like protein